MNRYQGTDAVADRPRKRPIVTLGVFDGVHRGHQEVLRAVVEQARATGGGSWILTFENHPDLVLEGTAPSQITSLEHRLRLFESLGVDACWILPFDQSLRSLTAERFVRDFLAKKLHIRGIVLGAGARFGFGGMGNIGLLEDLGPELGFEVRTIPPALLGGSTISSTRIREAIVNGDLDQASSMLGRPCSVLGPVVAGEGRGDRIGIPTANLVGPFVLLPPAGVYLSQAVLEGEAHFAVTNIGWRPTFRCAEGDVAGLTVETHILDLRRDLKDRMMEVRFLERIRDEVKFPDVDSLVRQIRKDLEWARQRVGNWSGLLEKTLTPQPGGL